MQIDGAALGLVTGALAPRLRQVQTERGTVLKALGVVDDAFDRGRVGGLPAHLIKQHVGVTNGHDERVADVMHHLGRGLTVADLHLVLLLFGHDRLIHALQVLEEGGALLALQRLGRVTAHGGL